MKALLLKAYESLEMTDIPKPGISPDELLIRVRACGICGSDVHGYDGSTGRRIPPIVMGHEAAGVVAETGSGVKSFSPGDRVTFDSTMYCGECFFCRRGLINLCDNRRVLGVSCADYRQNGAFAEYVAVPQRIVYKLPDNLSFEHAAMIEAVSIAVHAVGRMPLAAGDSALVVGAGMIGQLIVQCLRAFGCEKVIAIDLDDSRLALAKKLGANYTFNARASDLSKNILDLTGSRGVDCAYDAVGNNASFQTAVAALRKGGSLSLVGNLSAKVDLPLQAVVTRQITLLGSCASAGEYPTCMELMAAGKVQVAPLISAIAPLEEGASWFSRLHKTEPGLMKVILTPGAI